MVISDALAIWNGSTAPPMFRTKRGRFRIIRAAKATQYSLQGRDPLMIGRVLNDFGNYARSFFRAFHHLPKSPCQGAGLSGLEVSIDPFENLSNIALPRSAPQYLLARSPTIDAYCWSGVMNISHHPGECILLENAKYNN